MIKALWHRLHGHDVHRLGRIEPTYTRGGIRVFEQDAFRPPMAHWHCTTCDRALL